MKKGSNYEQAKGLKFHQLLFLLNLSPYIKLNQSSYEQFITMNYEKTA